VGYSQPAQPRQRRRRHIWIRLLLILIVVFILIDVVPTPWALHIGGRFTPLTTWDGYGPVRATDGGKYVLFTHLQGGIIGTHGRLVCDGRGRGGCDTLHGSAKLCTEGGATYTFALTGAVHTWWSTDGARSNIDLAGVSPTALPEGWVVAFHGFWHGPALALASPDNSFTEVFTPRGAIRHVTSTADAGGATVTLRYGSSAGFASACHALAAG
jgi:hypothetical protein